MHIPEAHQVNRLIRARLGRAYGSADGRLHTPSSPLKVVRPVADARCDSPGSIPPVHSDPF